MAESPRGRAQTPHQRLTRGPLGAAAKWAPYCGRRCCYTATWGAAKRRPTSLCQSALAHSTLP
eukprot:1319487-Alexandrium_andersonii.AAC.1